MSSSVCCKVTVLYCSILLFIIKNLLAANKSNFFVKLLVALIIP